MLISFCFNNLNKNIKNALFEILLLIFQTKINFEK